MQDKIRQQMHRYPIFNCQPESYIDQCQLFKDEDIKAHDKRNLSLLSRNNEKKNQTIVTIYDRIITNNANDPLYVHAKREKQKIFSTVTSARNSRCDLQRSVRKHDKTKVISRFMGQLATSLTKEESKVKDVHRTQKISLLKRIIEHYNTKSIQRKYYSNLIKNFGIKIQSINSNDIAIKKNLHPRQNTAKKSISKQITQSVQTDPNEQASNCNKLQEKLQKKRNFMNIVKPSHSFILAKQYSFQHSRQNLGEKLKDKQIQDGMRLRGQISQKMRRKAQYSYKLVQKPIKMQNSTCIQDKINKYKDFLFMINFSNHMYKNLDAEKYQKPLKFYVGRGNNKNLIKSLMKKRFWFQETNNITEANFIWTQIKVQQTFSKQISKIQTNQQINTIQHQQMLLTHQGQITQQSATNRLLQDNLKVEDIKQNAKFIKFSKCKSRAKDYAPQDPTLKILTKDEMKLIKSINQALVYKKYYNFSDKMKMSSRQLKEQTQFHIVHNHLPANGLLGNKKALFYNIRQYCKLSGKKLSDYIPPTFHIKKGLSDQDYKSVAAIFMERKKLKMQNYWIMKPGQFSNRGQGITCTNKLQDIRQRVTKCRELSRTGKQATLIVQQYIANPLLYNGRKFDIRVYMMVTINNGKMKGYWYQQGYIRTSSFMWSLNEMQDKFIHLTNDAVQKNCQEYGLYQPGNKLTFIDLQRYLHTLPKCGRNMQFFEVIYPQMRSIAADAIRCASLNLDPNRLRDNFQIFGLDFMVDQNIKPWLIQVNTNPCLELSCPILQRIIPYMVQNALRIALDPLFPPPSTALSAQYKYSIPENALHYNKFELVFDEDRDGQSLRKLYKNSNIMQQIDDFQEDQQIYEGEGQIIDIGQT